MNKSRVALHVILPLTLGLAAYVVFRQSDIRLFAWMRWLGLDACIAVVRDASAPLRMHAPRWLTGSLPDAAWAYAFGATLALVWRGSSDRIGTRAWLAIGALVTALLELGQAAHIIPGVFDLIDLVTMLLGFGLATTILARARVSPRHVVAVVASVGVLLAAEPRAAACGGCFHPPKENPTVVTDHRMIFAVAPKQTTLYDQMRYTGSPSSFAWVLPIGGLVTIGLSSDELFSVLDTQTGVQVLAPPTNCYIPPSCLQAFPPSGSLAGAAPGGGGGGVTVFAHEVVGPYETVQLRATDPKALATWLAAHHYEITPDAQTIIDAYVNEKSAFLAMKLVPGATVQAMRPVRVTSPGASVTLPLRMVAAGAGATLGVTLWVVSEGRYEPQNFPFFTIDASDVVWDWTTSSSNYATIRAAKSKAADNTGWQIESSLDLATATVENQLKFMEQSPPRPPVKRIDTPRDAGPPEKSTDEQRAEDLDVLFGGTSTHAPTVRVTRMRADLAHAALSRDLRVQASASQALLSNIVQVTREAGQQSCVVYDEKCGLLATAPRLEAEAKNKALKNPHFANGSTGPTGTTDTTEKKWFSCAASPHASSAPPLSLFAALAVAVAFIVRRRDRRP